VDNIFSRIRVVDLTKVFSGPFATRMLADYGAEVIKIENKVNYDDSRNYPPLKNDWSGYYEILNRNKKSISLNLTNPKELQMLYNLVKDADVFVENLTSSTKFKLKIDYETLKSFNPKLVYASLSGLGQNNDKKYYDVIAQAQSGLMSLSGDGSKPIKIGPAIVDAFSGMTLAFAIAGALFYREKNNIGQYLDVSMLACAMNLLENNLIEYSITKKNPIPPEDHDNAISPFGIYKAKNGYIVVAVGNDNLWNKLLQFLKQHIEISQELFSSNNLRLKNNGKLTLLLENVFAVYETESLIHSLSDLGIPCSKVYKMSDVASEEDNFKNKRLLQFNHPLLGQCVVPGFSINFSIKHNGAIRISPKIGEDNKNYGI
jgi:crotonobetainyl-CoA:carnitine CoA-transferase CaiB-like acyl-CoA transferase